MISKILVAIAAAVSLVGLVKADSQSANFYGIHDIFETAEGAIYSGNSGASLVNGDITKALVSQEKLREIGSIYSAVEYNGDILLASKRGYIYSVNQQSAWHQFAPTHALQHLYVTQNNELLILGKGLVAIKQEGQPVIPILRDTSEQAVVFRRVLEVGNVLYLAANNGIYQFDRVADSSFSHLSLRHTLKGAHASAAMGTTLYLSNVEGIHAYDTLTDTLQQVYSAKEMIYALSANDHGIFAGIGKHVYRLIENGFNSYQLQRVQSIQHCGTVYALTVSAHWAGVYVGCMRGASYIPVNTPTKMEGISGQTVLAQYQGELWAATNGKGVNAFIDGKRQHMAMDHLISADTRFYHIAASKYFVTIASSKGLIIYRKQKQQAELLTLPRSIGALSSLIVESSKMHLDVLIAADPSGLWRYRAGKLLNVIDDHYYINQILPLPQLKHTFLLATNHGIKTVNITSQTVGNIALRGKDISSLAILNSDLYAGALYSGFYKVDLTSKISTQLTTHNIHWLYTKNNNHIVIAHAKGLSVFDRRNNREKTIYAAPDWANYQPLAITDEHVYYAHDGHVFRWSTQVLTTNDFPILRVAQALQGQQVLATPHIKGRFNDEPLVLQLNNINPNFNAIKTRFKYDFAQEWNEAKDIIHLSADNIRGIDAMLNVEIQDQWGQWQPALEQPIRIAGNLPMIILRSVILVVLAALTGGFIVGRLSRLREKTRRQDRLKTHFQESQLSMSRQIRTELDHARTALGENFKSVERVMGRDNARQTISHIDKAHTLAGEMIWPYRSPYYPRIGFTTSLQALQTEANLAGNLLIDVNVPTALHPTIQFAVYNVTEQWMEFCLAHCTTDKRAIIKARAVRRFRHFGVQHILLTCEGVLKPMDAGFHQAGFTKLIQSTETALGQNGNIEKQPKTLHDHVQVSYFIELLLTDAPVEHLPLWSPEREIETIDNHPSSQRESAI